MHECEAKRNGEQVQLTSTGKDPFVIIRDVPAVSGKLTLEFAMQSRTAGGGQLFWCTEEAPNTSPASSVRFSTTHNWLWHEYRVPFEIDSPLTALRLDLCSEPGELRIAGLRLVDAEGLALKEWLPQWKATTISGDAVIRAPVGTSEIVITTTSRLAGAIHSLTWNGKEFIDSLDHGRQLQSACSFGEPRGFHAECYNPTEAGSRLDAAGPRSSSKLLELRTTERSLQTLSQMAFWLAPWEASEGKPALNKEARSNHYLSKIVTIGYRDLPQVIDYRVTFRVPFDERPPYAQFESLTGYMPVEFDHFWGFNASSGELEKLPVGQGEQNLPVVLATADGQFAMGIFSPTPSDTRLGKPRYGRFQFREAGTMKWNCVYRVHNPQGIAPGEYSFQHYVAVGDLATVKATLAKLQDELSQPAR
jgi:hypothetical protein